MFEAGDLVKLADNSAGSIIMEQDMQKREEKNKQEMKGTEVLKYPTHLRAIYESDMSTDFTIIASLKRRNTSSRATSTRRSSRLALPPELRPLRPHVPSRG